CKEDYIVYYSDINGDWGFENNNWCGCGDSDLNLEYQKDINIESFELTCDLNSVPYEEGDYECCNNCDVFYVDNIRWGIKENKWCIISDFCDQKFYDIQD
ncbi:hypothetical protein H8356DRAFT_948925, partial [Neocallimastix lanati (nom. inval.)]